MAWIVGIDEAGYGPNLGPFVMSMVACKVPDVNFDGDLWKALRRAVCRGRSKGSESLALVDDSKVVFTRAGLAGLERAVLAIPGEENGSTLAGYVEPRCAAGWGDLLAEKWFSGKTLVPANVDGSAIGELKAKWAENCEAEKIGSWMARTVVVPAPRFNTLIEEEGSKGAVLAHAFICLLAEIGRIPGEDALYFTTDKHGGRNTYAGLVQRAVNEGMVIVREESALNSAYQVVGLSRDMHLSFQPRADGSNFCVALASMMSKYLREMFMQEFNAFWRGYLPELLPTAGYPGDAARFMQAILPTARKLGIEESSIWRVR